MNVVLTERDGLADGSAINGREDYFEVKTFPAMCCAPAAVLWRRCYILDNLSQPIRYTPFEADTILILTFHIVECDSFCWLGYKVVKCNTFRTFYSVHLQLYLKKKSQQSAFPLFSSVLLEHVYLLTKDCLISQLFPTRVHLVQFLAITHLGCGFLNHAPIMGESTEGDHAVEQRPFQDLSAKNPGTRETVWGWDGGNFN